MFGYDSRPALRLMLFVVLLFSITDVQAKYLSQTLPIFQIAWALFFGHFLLVTLMFWPKRRWNILSSSRTGLQIFRGALLVVSILLFFTALHFMPLADAVAIISVSPILVTALSVPLLKERVGLRRWVAVGVGFTGAVIIIRPGMGMMHWSAFLALGAAFSSALFFITTRMLSTTDDSVTSLFYPALIGTAALSPIVLFHWEHPTSLLEVVLLLGLGVSNAVSHRGVVKAYQLAPVAVLAPMSYSELLWSTLFGFLIFGDFPDQWTLLGAGIVVASGLYIFHREGRPSKGFAGKASKVFEPDKCPRIHHRIGSGR